MIKVIDVCVQRRWAQRPTNNTIICDTAWGVEKGEWYDLVQFHIDQLPNRFWKTSLAFPIDMTEEEIKKETQEYAERYIDEQDIKNFNEFLRDISEFGCE